MDFLSDLNPEQRVAVEHTEGPLLILAGAGSGKTRVIAHRIAYLLAVKGVPSWNILAVTFTNKAAQEMRRRVQELLRGEQLAPGIPWLSTFHSLCVRILRQDIERLNQNYSRSFTIYDQDDSARLVRNCLSDLGYDEQKLAPRSVQAAISNAKNRGQSAVAYAAGAGYEDPRRASIAKVFEIYEERLRANNALDFDDLLIKAVRVLRKDREVREKYNNKFRYILVDEYQDTNMLQFALIRLLTEQQQNICVVGDEDQSIYKWRGADISNILDFEKHFPNAKTIRLEQNYRSTQVILDVAGAVVQNNIARKGKTLWTSNPKGERVRYYQAPDAEGEARFVAAKIIEHRDEQYDIRAAVLYRTNAQSRVFEEVMRRVGLAYNIVGGFSFYERKEVRDIIAYLKLALNPTDSIALARVINSPPRGIGKRTLDEIDRRAKENGVSHWQAISLIIEKPETLNRAAISALKNFRQIILRLGELVEGQVSEIVKAAILDSGYENALKSENTEEAQGRLENLQELVNAAMDYDKLDDEGLREFIDHAALVSDQDQYNPDAQVTLMTAHSAKGLEFPLVFIVGLENGLFPHSRAATDVEELEEERRLCYVAMTRAQQYLYVTHTIKRRIYGREIASEPSLFLNEMPPESIEDLSLGGSWLYHARGSSKINLERGEPHKERKKFAGKTYDSAESIAEFFNQRREQTGRGSSVGARSHGPVNSSDPNAGSEFVPGSYVRHAKYGKGLVLRREGEGDALKLTVTFAGYGQKKLIQKYAGLKPA